MKRREFLRRTSENLGLFALGTLGLTKPTMEQTSVSGNFPSQPIVIDALCSPADFTSDPLPLKTSQVQEDMESGIHAVNWTISGTDFESTVNAIAYAEALVESDPGRWLIVRRHADIKKAKREHKVGLILGFQFPEPLGTDLSRLEMFRRLGVLVVQLTYNNRSLFGDGCLEPGNAGLSKLGRAAIARMNELGIALDLSHSGKKTTAEGIQASTKPVLITHSGCNEVHRHPRNKDDEELRALADRGGVVGIYLMPYLTASPASPTKEVVVQHLEHALSICGAEHVGIGSDGPMATVDQSPEGLRQAERETAQRKHRGIAAPEEDRPPWVPDLGSSRRMAILAAEMQRRGHAPAVIEGVLGSNFHRVLGEIWRDTRG